MACRRLFEKLEKRGSEGVLRSVAENTTKSVENILIDRSF